MKTTVEQIREVIESKGGVMAFNSSIRRGRFMGRPTRFNTQRELLELSDAELNIAFYLGLTGNNGHKGTIVENSTRFGNICNV